MRYYFMNDEFKIATEKANAVIEKLPCNSGFIKTEQIISTVSDLLSVPTRIDCFYTSFSKSKIDDDYGAMMCVIKDGEQGQVATIVVNSDKDIRFQRFSLIHELGHLITGHYTATDNENRYTVSTHIKYDITSIKEEDCKESKILKNEQIANIFALKVLMPYETFMQQLFEHDDFQSIADFFGVTKDAVRSRFLLGA